MLSRPVAGSSPVFRRAVAWVRGSGCPVARHPCWHPQRWLGESLWFRGSAPTCEHLRSPVHESPRPDHLLSAVAKAYRRSRRPKSPDRKPTRGGVSAPPAAAAEQDGGGDLGRGGCRTLAPLD